MIGSVASVLPSSTNRISQLLMPVRASNMGIVRVRNGRIASSSSLTGTMIESVISMIGTSPSSLPASRRNPTHAGNDVSAVDAAR